MLLNLFRDCENNVGDKVTSPLDFFPDLDGMKKDVWGITAADLEGNEIILGGGGISIFKESISVLEPFAERIIVWGMGANQPIVCPTPLRLPAFLQRCPLVGIRDWGTAYPWLPCVSCLHPAFDQQPQESHKVGFYEHWEIPLQNPGEPLLKNNCEFTEAIAFLSSCETIVTNSYHGAYWGVLLGKKVLVEPINTKLLNMKHQPAIILNRDWRQSLKRAVAYPDALRECREANYRFHEETKKTLASCFSQRPIFST